MLDIPQEWLKQVKEILEKYISDSEVCAFGSRVTGKSKKYSDLDLVIKARLSLDNKTIALLRNDFEESNLPIKVDIVEWNALSDSFKAIVEEKYEVI